MQMKDIRQSNEYNFIFIYILIAVQLFFGVSVLGGIVLSVINILLSMCCQIIFEFF